jgi:hypothetical protein
MLSASPIHSDTETIAVLLLALLVNRRFRRMPFRITAWRRVAQDYANRGYDPSANCAGTACDTRTNTLPYGPRRRWRQCQGWSRRCRYRASQSGGISPRERRVTHVFVQVDAACVPNRIFADPPSEKRIVVSCAHVVRAWIGVVEIAQGADEAEGIGGGAGHGGDLPVSLVHVSILDLLGIVRQPGGGVKAVEVVVANGRAGAAGDELSELVGPRSGVDVGAGVRLGQNVLAVP